MKFFDLRTKLQEINTNLTQNQPCQWLSRWLKTTPPSARGEQQTMIKHICICVCLHTYIYECLHTCMFSLSGYVLTHIPVPILANILLRTHAYTCIHTHTVSHVTHTRHTIVVNTSSEKLEVDSLHHEKKSVHLFSLEHPCLLECLLV